MKIEFDYVAHQYEGRKVIFALSSELSDTYTSGLRRSLPVQTYLGYVLRRAKQMGRSIKVADFGANVGVVSLPLAAHGLQLLAVEALPANFAALSTAARINGFRNLRPINMAALDEIGVATVTGFSAWGGARVKDEGGTTPCDTLTHILEIYDFAEVEIIKIDIEGAELPALAGAEEFLRERPETEVIFESNNHTCQLFGYDRQDLLRRFEQWGFRGYVFRAEGLMPVRAEDPQPVPVVDILATRRTAAVLEQQGERIVPLTDDYIVQELMRISKSENPHIRKHFVTEAGRVSDSVRRSPHWPKIASAVGG